MNLNYMNSFSKNEPQGPSLHQHVLFTNSELIYHQLKHDLYST